MTIKNINSLISIIIPIFQVEKYLDKCISSIVTQSYHNIEIILVDDGSFDNSSTICDRWRNMDSRIKVIHKINGGLSQARNWGLKLAKGDFIGFVDSDDWIEPNMYEVLMSAIQETNADIAICDYRLVHEDSKVEKINVISSSRKLFSSEEALKMIIKGENLHSFVWNKLYKRKVISSIFFPESKIYEDILWTCKVVGNANILVHVGRQLYHYLYRPISLSHNNQQIAKRQLNIVEMREQRIEYIHKYFPTLEQTAIQCLQQYCCWTYVDISINYYHLDVDEAIRQYLLQHFYKYKLSIFTERGNSIKQKVSLIIFWLRPKLFLKTYILYKKKNILLKKITQYISYMNIKNS